MGNRVYSRGKGKKKEGGKEKGAKQRKFKGCKGRRTDVRRIYVRKVVFQFHLSWKVHWLRRTEVPPNYYHRAFADNVQNFLLFLQSPKPWFNLPKLLHEYVVFLQTICYMHLPTRSILRTWMQEARAGEWQLELEDQTQFSAWAGCSISLLVSKQ